MKGFFLYIQLLVGVHGSSRRVFMGRNAGDAECFAYLEHNLALDWIILVQHCLCCYLRYCRTLHYSILNQLFLAACTWSHFSLFNDWLIFFRKLFSDWFWTDTEKTHVALYDNVLFTEFSIRGGELDLIPNSKRWHSGQDGLTSHTIFGPCKSFFTLFKNNV